MNLNGRIHFSETKETLRTLRDQAAKLGISTEGKNRQDLFRDINAYHERQKLGVAGLLVSMPHVAAELAELMHVEVGYAFLLAFTIDLGICEFDGESVNHLRCKFPTPTRVTVIGVMVSCFVLSALLNAAQFTAHAEGVLTVVLGTTLAVFLAVFVWSTFFVASNMLLYCHPKSKEEKKSPVDVLLSRAKELKDLLKAVESFS